MRRNDNILSFPLKVNKKLEVIWEEHDKGNDVEALQACISLIDDGYPEAYVFAAAFYEKGGKGIEPDLSKARFYYEKSIEEYGATEAYLGLARIYYYGLGVEKDYCKAKSIYSQLVEESNNPPANLMLGRMYQEGLCVEQDYDKATQHYERAWQAGYIYGLTYLGLLEQRKGNWLKGIFLRLKAGFHGIGIIWKHPHDPRVRNPQ